MFRSLNLRRANGPLWGVGDQAISSAGNVLLTITVARNGTSADFGAFSVVLATHFILLTSSRALVSMPLMMAYGDRRRGADEAAAGSASLALMVGLLVAVLLVGVGLLMGGRVGHGLMIYAVICPMLLLQDSLRIALNVTRGVKATTINDSLWTFLQTVAFLPGFFGVWAISSFTYMLLWGCTAGVAAVAACVSLRLLPRLKAGLKYARDNIKVGPALLLEGLAASASAQIATYVLAVVGGLSVVGHLQATTVLFGPVNIVFMGVLFVAVPAAVRIARRDSGELVRTCLTAGAGLAVFALVATLVAMLIPAQWGRELLGESWVGPTLILPTGLAVAANALTLGAMVGWRAVGVAKQTMFLQLMLLPVPTVGTVCGYAVFGTIGAAYGLAISATVVSTVMWSRLRRHIKGGGADRLVPT